MDKVKTIPTDRTDLPNVKFLEVDGLKASQNIFVIEFLESLPQVDLIIEIGTANGGFALLLRMLFPDAEIHTWDIVEYKNKEVRFAKFAEYAINYHIQDCFESRELKSLCSGNQTKILFCDGAHKNNEFNHFADFINPGDYIGAHDFFLSENHYDPEIWTICEVTEGELMPAINKHDLTPFKAALSRQAAWGFYKK